jgi:hypothetical protein
MEYAARLPKAPSRRTIVAPLVALVLGAGVATGAYALIDNGDQTSPSQVIVVERPGPHAAEIPGKNESATAAAISHSGGVELRGSKASGTNTQSSGGPSAAEELRTDPHGPGISLRNP